MRLQELRAAAAEADATAAAFAAKVRAARAARAQRRTHKKQAYGEMYRARQAYRLALARYHRQGALFRQSARRAKAAERGQRDAFARQAARKAAHVDVLRALYGEWLTGHPGASRDECLAIIRGLAGMSGVSTQQVMRDVGVQVFTRTRDESDEDMRRHLAGMPIRAIARERQLTPQAVRNAIRRQLLARAMHGAAADSDAAQ